MPADNTFRREIPLESCVIDNSCPHRQATDNVDRKLLRSRPEGQRAEQDRNPDKIRAGRGGMRVGAGGERARKAGEIRPGRDGRGWRTRMADKIRAGGGRDPGGGRA
ncbi:hypothetical protein GCM10023214_38160 [Amycolatopsis dongchuanensis]|uniref:Uncharacterized protein n=1 Tax=Amycolatopsis dongchuanensis TaxID=1070866 RepID=A0ABP9QRF5_9PSEU